ncbi:MAG: Holliday junction branch migration protein RuvA [Monoglobales bacterium]|jgi:Holliday junction DNA helicase RuvA
MYYYIKGKLALRGENYIVVDAHGVGYMIYTSLNTIQNVGVQGSEVTVYTYLNVREDAHELYGFATLEEKTLFMQLLSVSGVGAKVALSVLSVLTPAAFAQAVIFDDIKAITKAPGVGPKVAKRIVLELKDKIKKADIEAGGKAESINEVGSDSRSEAVSALLVLGYSITDAQSAVAGVDASLTVEEIIKQALVRLM